MSSTSRRQRDCLHHLKVMPFVPTGGTAATGEQTSSTCCLWIDAAGCFDLLDHEPFRGTVDPGGLQAHGSVVGPPALVGQDDELRAAVMRVGLACDEPFVVRVVDDPLRVLAIGAE